MISAQDIIALLKLEPHPEGGFYRRTYRHKAGPGERGFGTAIYYLIEGSDNALWHRTDGDEIWHWYAGAPLTLSIADKAHTVTEYMLSNDFGAGHRPQILVPGNHWQHAASAGDWTLCGCTVSPGFEFASYELAAPDGFPGKK
ncbi:cupin domain-containing protein [Kordiimonas aestuarii]|uniref:cupin domain-containing protein n=1 Tax=Kordiimonas aestuarii TaxID=1005925 RepID=UPI0021D256C1|nr:cupin domain-containing protein [Kordiimonas aestuarii]